MVLFKSSLTIVCSVDIPVAFVQLAENPPWTKRDKNGMLNFLSLLC